MWHAQARLVDQAQGTARRFPGMAGTDLERARGLRRRPTPRGGGAPSGHAGRCRSACTDHGPGLPRCRLPHPRRPGASHPGVRTGWGPLLCLRRAKRVTTDRGWPWLRLSAPGASRRGVCVAGGGDQGKSRAWVPILPTGSYGSVKPIVWRDAARRLGSTLRGARPGSAAQSTRGRSACAAPAWRCPCRRCPSHVEQAEAHYQQALALAEALGHAPTCGPLPPRTRPAVCHMGQRGQADAALCRTIALYERWRWPLGSQRRRPRWQRWG